MMASLSYWTNILQVQGAVHSYLTSAEVRNALGKVASVLHGNAECWKQNPLLERPPTADLSLPPPPSSRELELAFGTVGEVVEATLEKLKATVLGMLVELKVDCRRIEASVKIFISSFSWALLCRNPLGLMWRRWWAWMTLVWGGLHKLISPH